MHRSRAGRDPAGAQPLGRLFLIWNERDHSEAWIRDLDEVVDSLALGEGVRPYHHQDTDWAAVVDGGGGFTPVEHSVYDNPTVGTPDGLVVMVWSMSYVAVRLDEERQRAVCPTWCADSSPTHPDLAGSA